MASAHVASTSIDFVNAETDKEVNHSDSECHQTVVGEADSTDDETFTIVVESEDEKEEEEGAKAVPLKETEKKTKADYNRREKMRKL